MERGAKRIFDLADLADLAEQRSGATIGKKDEKKRWCRKKCARAKVPATFFSAEVECGLAQGKEGARELY